MSSVSLINGHIDDDEFDVVEKISTILAELLDTPCNFSPTDEWLPYLCDHANTCNCEYKECWKQLFKYWDKRETGGYV